MGDKKGGENETQETGEERRGVMRENEARKCTEGEERRVKSKERVMRGREKNTS